MLLCGLLGNKGGGNRKAVGGHTSPIFFFSFHSDKKNKPRPQGACGWRVGGAEVRSESKTHEVKMSKKMMRNFKKFGVFLFLVNPTLLCLFVSPLSLSLRCATSRPNASQSKPMTGRHGQHRTLNTKCYRKKKKKTTATRHCEPTRSLKHWVIISGPPGPRLRNPLEC